jgi:hypothetical protein
MNTIGIDYQQTLSVIYLREGRGTAQFRSIGDGLRHLIPNVALGENLWGSRALQTDHPEELSRGHPTQEGPWLDGSGVLPFWRGIAQRLYSYLGRVNPVLKNGYQIVVGLQAADFTDAAERIEEICREAGLNDITSVRACDVLLCRWLGEAIIKDPGKQAVVTVVVGDTITTISVYRLQWDSNNRLSRLTSNQVCQHLPFGHTQWMAKLLSMVLARFSEPLDPAYELAIQDACIEFVQRLAKERDDCIVEWTGFLREWMYAPLGLTRRDCAMWPEAQRFCEALPAAVNNVLTTVTNTSSPDQIVIGGIGALWPFVTGAAAHIGPLWLSGAPQGDIARGCTWWPEFRSLFSETPLLIETVPMGEQEWETESIPLGEGAGLLIDWQEPEVREEFSADESAEGLDNVPLPPWKRSPMTDF